MNTTYFCQSTNTENSGGMLTHYTKYHVCYAIKLHKMLVTDSEHNGFTSVCIPLTSENM
jgi:hypothetical protein